MLVVIINVALEVDQVAVIAITVVKINVGEVVRGINLVLATEVDLLNAVTLAILVVAIEIVGK